MVGLARLKPDLLPSASFTRSSKEMVTVFHVVPVFLLFSSDWGDTRTHTRGGALRGLRQRFP